MPLATARPGTDVGSHPEQVSQGMRALKDWPTAPSAHLPSTGGLIDVVLSAGVGGSLLPSR